MPYLGHRGGPDPLTTQTMTFTLTGTDKYGIERIEFRAHSSDTQNAKAVEVIRWAKDSKGSWYQLWHGFHFVGNARTIYRDRIKKGWTAA
jgi:hypothetical protein